VQFSDEFEMVLQFEQFKDQIGALLRHSGTLVFRGQADGRWPLRTSLHRYCEKNSRTYSVENFLILLRGFTDGASDFLSEDLRKMPLLDQIALAQHHGIPTPFLDWTRSPYIATFFALWNSTAILNKSPTFKVYALNLTEVQRLISAHNALEEITESNLFRLDCPLRIITTKLFESKRLMRQMGLFTLCGHSSDLKTYLSSQDGFSCLHEFEIDGRDAGKVLRELGMMGISASTLLDTLDGVAIDVLNSATYSPEPR
jgi:FRG domain